MGHHNQKEQNAQLMVIREQQEKTQLELVAMNKKMDVLIARFSALEASVAPSVVPDRNSDAGSIEQFWSENITEIAPLRYQMRRAGVDRLLKEPTKIARGCRIVPAMRDGKAVGFKLYAIRPTSIWAKLGFENGDTLHSINRIDLNTHDMGMQVYVKLKEETLITIQLTRKAKPIEIEIAIEG